jgi:hypothetical protein
MLIFPCHVVITDTHHSLMATAADAVTYSAWIWSAPHDDYYIASRRPDGTFSYIFAKSLQPSQTTKSSTSSAVAQCTPNKYVAPIAISWFRCTYLTTYHSSNQQLYFSTGYQSTPASSAILTYPEPQSSTPRNAVNSRSSSTDTHHPPTSISVTARYYPRAMGYCDYPYCQDAYCIETQMAEKGIRDDLRHHEDEDKNGNMGDGGNVGSQTCIGIPA